MSAEIPAGWYPNPWNDAEELYWSGTEWTGISRTAHRSAPQAAAGGVGAFVQASDVEESTVMRPIGGSLTSAGAAAPAAAPAAPEPWAQQPSWAPQPTGYTAVHPDHMTFQYGHVDAPGTADAFPDAPQNPYAAPAAYAASAPAAPEFNTGTTQELPPYPGSTDAATIRWALDGAAAPAPARNPRARFGLVSMILGIAAAVFAVVPGLSFAAWLPAFVAIALGIMAFLAGRPRGFALAGIISGGAALAVGTGVSIWFMVQLGALGH